MKIEIDLDFLYLKGLDANQFIVLQLMLKNNTNRLNEFQRTAKNNYYQILSELIELDFLSVEEDGLEFTAKTIRNFKTNNFQEFYEAYPTSTIRPDGTRDSLRTDKKRCETKYRRLAPRLDLHEHIMKCLKCEIEDRTRTGKMAFMKRMPNYLSSEAWTEYEDKVNQVTSVYAGKGDYGTSIIT